MSKQRLGSAVLVFASAMVGIVASGGMSTAAPWFDAPYLSFGTAGRASGVALADFDSDGHTDLASVGSQVFSSNSWLSIYLGAGDGTFGVRTDLPTGSDPYGVAAGDVNSDGHPDIVVGGSPTRLFLGRGDGTFESPRDLPGYSQFAVLVVDLNGDSRMDVVSTSGDGVTILRGHGDGSFDSPITAQTGGVATAIAAGQLNADRYLDLAVSDAMSGSVGILLGHGDGLFDVPVRFLAGSYPNAIGIANMDGDSDQDIVVAHTMSNTVSVFAGNGDGTFQSGLQFVTGRGPRALVVGDMSGDGVPDVATANWYASSVAEAVSVLFGAGDGTLQPKRDFYGGRGPFCLAAGPIDGDGTLDLVAGWTYSDYGAVAVLLGNGDGTFGVLRSVPIAQRPTYVAAGDLDRDGRVDLVSANGYSGDIAVMPGNGDGTFGPHVDYYSGYDPQSLVIGDLNHDGLPDLAVANSNQSFGYSTIAVFLGLPGGGFGPRATYDAGSGPRWLTTADVNGDQNLDLLSICSGWQRISVFPGLGDGRLGPRLDMTSGPNPSALGAADMNGDGRTDLIVSGSGWVGVHLGRGDATFEPLITRELSGTHSCLAIADFNGDLRPDVAVANLRVGSSTHGRTVWVLLGNGDGTLMGPIEVRVGLAPSFVSAADVTRDGIPDILTVNAQSLTVSVVPSKGDGTFNPCVDFGAGRAPLGAAVVDLNADAWPDLAVADGVDAVHVMMGLGCSSLVLDLSPNTLNLSSMGRWVTGTLEPERPALPTDIDIASILLNGSVPVDASGPTSIGDVDGDGRPDLTVKFDRAAVELAVQEGDAVTVTVTGKIGGGCFEATDVIQVRRGHVAAPSAGSVLQGGSTTEVRWDTPAGADVQSVTVLFSTDDGATWNLEARELPDTARYVWTVPDVGTDRARVAVVLVESADASGFDVNGVVGVSGRFTVTTAVGVAGANVSFALHGAIPNPSRGLNVSFSLANAEPATLALYDVGGRQVSTRQVGSLGAGRHVVSFGAAGRLAPGVYLVRLVQGDRHLVARAVVIR